MTMLATPNGRTPTNGHLPPLIHPIQLAEWTPAQPAPTPTPDLKTKLDADLQKSVRRSGQMRQLFYVVVLNVALAGQVTGAVDALGIPLIAAIPAVAALELGGIVVLNNADVRRRLGERATGSRILSAAIAAWAVAFNWMAHDNKLLAGFFAGMSALGYCVWVMHTENQRRDRLRATGDLPAVTPAYELVGHWLTHPLLTRRARSMAKADARLGLYASLDAARAHVDRTRRLRAIARVMRQEMRTKTDADSADIALAVYDLERIAARLADEADYDGLTRLVAARLHPERVTGATATDAQTHSPARTEVRPEVRTHTRPELPFQTQTDAPERISADAFIDAMVELEEARERTEAEAPPVRAPRLKRGQNGRVQPHTSGASVDTDAIKRLHALARANGGTVSVRRAMGALGVGAPVAKRHMRAAGLLPASDDNGNGAAS